MQLTSALLCFLSVFRGTPLKRMSIPVLNIYTYILVVYRGGGKNYNLPWVSSWLAMLQFLANWTQNSCLQKRLYMTETVYISRQQIQAPLGIIPRLSTCQITIFWTCTVGRPIIAHPRGLLNLQYLEPVPVNYHLPTTKISLSGPLVNNREQDFTQQHPQPESGTLIAKTKLFNLLH